jgi:hypothetical protein
MEKASACIATASFPPSKTVGIHDLRATMQVEFCSSEFAVRFSDPLPIK